MKASLVTSPSHPETHRIEGVGEGEHPCSADQEGSPRQPPEATEPSGSGEGEGPSRSSVRRWKRQREHVSARQPSDPGPAAAPRANATAAYRGGRGKRIKGGAPHLNNGNTLMHPRSRFFGGPLNFSSLAEKHPALSPFLSVSPTGRMSFDFRTRGAQLELCIALFKCIYHISFSLPPDQSFLVPTLPNRSNYIHFLADLLSQTEGLEPPKGPPIQGGDPYIIRGGPHEALDSCSGYSQEATERGTEQGTLLPQEDGGPPRGPQVRILDIGVGANCVYPLLGVADYDWSFVGSDISSDSLSVAAENINRNNYQGRISLRQQRDTNNLFSGVVYKTDMLFAASLCNPPFYTSEEAIGFNPNREKGGSVLELVCDGGEEAFLSRMLKESKTFCFRFIWFTSLVARATTRDSLKREIHDGMRKVGKKQEEVMQSKVEEWCKLYSNSSSSESKESPTNSGNSGSSKEEKVEMHPRELRVFELSQGKQTRWVVCWTYWTKEQRKLLRQFLRPKP